MVAAVFNGVGRAFGTLGIQHDEALLTLHALGNRVYETCETVGVDQLHNIMVFITTTLILREDAPLSTLITLPSGIIAFTIIYNSGYFGTHPIFGKIVFDAGDTLQVEVCPALTLLIGNLLTFPETFIINKTEASDTFGTGSLAFIDHAIGDISIATLAILKNESKITFGALTLILVILALL